MTTQIFRLTRARAFASGETICVRVYTTPNGSCLILTPDEWWRKLRGEPDPPGVFIRGSHRRGVNLMKASVLS